jgi:hypothetical protein
MFENVHLLCQKELILQRNIKKIHIIYNNSLKKIENKNILTTLKKPPKFLKCGIKKTLEIQMIFKITSKL